MQRVNAAPPPHFLRVRKEGFLYEKTETFENLKQHLIADLLNIKPETLSRKLKKFKEKGIIENNHSKIRVINKEKIKELFKW